MKRSPATHHRATLPVPTSSRDGQAPRSPYDAEPPARSPESPPKPWSWGHPDYERQRVAGAPIDDEEEEEEEEEGGAILSATPAERAAEGADDVEQVHGGAVRPHVGPNRSAYQRAKLYVIRSPNTRKVYVGSTYADSVEKRLQSHVNKYKRHRAGKAQHYITVFDVIKAGSPTIQTLGERAVRNRAELEAWEARVIAKFKRRGTAVNKTTPGVGASGGSLGFSKEMRDLGITTDEDYDAFTRWRAKVSHEQYEAEAAARREALKHPVVEGVRPWGILENVGKVAKHIPGLGVFGNVLEHGTPMLQAALGGSLHGGAFGPGTLCRVVKKVPDTFETDEYGNEDAVDVPLGTVVRLVRFWDGVEGEPDQWEAQRIDNPSVVLIGTADCFEEFTHPVAAAGAGLRGGMFRFHRERALGVKPDPRALVDALEKRPALVREEQAAVARRRQIDALNAEYSARVGGPRMKANLTRRDRAVEEALRGRYERLDAIRELAEHHGEESSMQRQLRLAEQARSARMYGPLYRPPAFAPAGEAPDGAADIGFVPGGRGRPYATQFPPEAPDFRPLVPRGGSMRYGDLLIH